MADRPRELCPMCDAPRPPRVNKCRCNYVFEYDTRVRDRGGGRHASSSPLLGGLVAIAATAGVLAAIGIQTQPGIAGHGETGLLLVPAGLFAVLGAVFDWGFFFGSRRARLIVAIASRTGARVIYAALGGALAGGGVGLLL